MSSTMELVWFCLIASLLTLACFMCKSGKRKPMFSAPVVVTTTTIPVPPGSGYPPPNAAIQGYPMPQPGYVPQPYPNQTIPPYPMPQTQSQPLPQADYNPPSYDQVMRGGEAYQKQAPYNPNYSGQ